MANTPLPLLMCPGWTGPGPGKGCSSGNAREVLGFGLEQGLGGCRATWVLAGETEEFRAEL